MARKRSSNALSILIILLGLLVGFIYYNGLESSVVPAAPREYPELLRFNSINLDFSVIDRLAFDNLKIFGDLPVRPGATGRNNLFTPF